MLPIEYDKPEIVEQEIADQIKKEKNVQDKYAYSAGYWKGRYKLLCLKIDQHNAAVEANNIISNY